MKVAKYIVLISAFLFVVNIFSCKEIKNEPDCHAPQEFLDYWFFPEGSWWVYTINDTILDSVVVKGISITPDEFGYPCETFYSMFAEHMNKDIPLEDYFRFSEGHNFQGFNSGCWYVNRQPGNNYWGFLYPFKYPFKIGEIIDGHWMKEDSLVTRISDTNFIDIKAGRMYNTIHSTTGWYYNTKEVPYYAATDVWFTKGVGITKIKYYYGMEIELLKYHINR